MKINKYFQNHHTYNKSWNELSVYQIWIISKPLVIYDNFMSLYNFFLIFERYRTTSDASDCNYLYKNGYKIKFLGIFHFQKYLCPISAEIQLYYNLASKPKQVW